MVPRLVAIIAGESAFSRELRTCVKRYATVGRSGLEALEYEEVLERMLEQEMLYEVVRLEPHGEFKRNGLSYSQILLAHDRRLTTALGRGMWHVGTPG